MKYTLELLDNTFLLVKPEGLLSDAEYDEIKPVLETMGGHWREKVKGFVFSVDSSHRESYTERQEELQFFPTPKKIAKRLVELSGIGELSCMDTPRVLEPSAGHGDLLDAIPSYIHQSEWVVEPDGLNAEVLRSKGHIVEEMTFEDFCNKNKNLQNTMDYVLMNPPFSKSRDVLHTMMAYKFLKKGGTLVSIISENALYYENDNSTKFRNWLKDKDVYTENIPYGSFKESGTTVDTVMLKIIKK